LFIQLFFRYIFVSVYMLYMITKPENIDLSKQTIREFFSDSIDRLGITFPSEDARQKTVNATSDSFKVILSKNVTTKDFVEAKVIQSTKGLVTNETLAKLEDKLDNNLARLDNSIARLEDKVHGLEDKVHILDIKIEKAVSTMVKWFMGAMIGFVAILLAVLVPLILTLRN